MDNVTKAEGGRRKAEDSSPYDVLELTRDVVDDARGVYGLRVKGNGFTDALINDGDIIILRRMDSCENGDLVAVWVKSQEQTTLKRYFAEGERVRLQPEDPTRPALYVARDDVQVQGKVIAVIRREAAMYPPEPTTEAEPPAPVEAEQAALFDLRGAR